MSTNKKDIHVNRSRLDTSLTHIKSYKSIFSVQTYIFRIVEYHGHERNKALHYRGCFGICQRRAQQGPQGVGGAGRKTILKENGWFLFQVGDSSCGIVHFNTCKNFKKTI